LNVAGREMGDEIALGAGAPDTLRVRADARSIAPMSRLEIVVNGKVAQTVPAGDSLHLAFDQPVSIPQGGWIAARVVGPASRYVGDSYAFAQTTPVYVVRNGRTFTSAEDARFLADVVEAIWTRTSRRPQWRTPAEGERFHAEIERARAVYERIAQGAAAGTKSPRGPGG
jgi:hypothetical protein